MGDIDSSCTRWQSRPGVESRRRATLELHRRFRRGHQIGIMPGLQVGGRCPRGNRPVGAVNRLQAPSPDTPGNVRCGIGPGKGRNRGRTPTEPLFRPP